MVGKKRTVNTEHNIAVCSRSFSKHETLRSELLSRYRSVTFNETGRQFEGQELIDFLRGHEKAIIALERIDERVLEALPELQVIGKYGVGLDMIDLDAMCRHGKRLGWTAGVNRRSVAELVLAFAISMLRHLPELSREVAAGRWQQLRGGLLSGRVVGIVGCGNVGKDLVCLLQPFGCRIIANDIRDYREFYQGYSVQPASLEELLTESDVITLHVPLDSSTENIISAERMALMKPTSILINTARGGLVDEEALRRALSGKRISAAAFDVFATEPPKDMELIGLPNFFATPHIGGSSEEAILAMGRAAIDGLDAHVNPTPEALARLSNP
jgi:phosphoglycerate dehydrogenase-like enzyme